jgi:hypothetical protein
VYVKCNPYAIDPLLTAVSCFHHHIAQVMASFNLVHLKKM